MNTSVELYIRANFTKKQWIKLFKILRKTGGLFKEKWLHVLEFDIMEYILKGHPIYYYFTFAEVDCLCFIFEKTSEIGKKAKKMQNELIAMSDKINKIKE